MKRLLLFFTLLAMTIPLWAGLQTVTINRNDGQFEEANGVYYCYKSGLMMTFTSGLNNPNYLVEHQQVYFEVRSVNPEYIIKKIVFHCVDNTTSDNLDCFYWGPSTISIVQNWTDPSSPGTYTYSGYTGTWRGETNKIQFTTMAKPVRFGSVDITFEKETGDIFDLVTDNSQLQAGHKYAIVNQYYGYAMSTFMNEDYNTTGRTKVSFVPETNKHKVIINDETRIVTLQNGTGVDDRPWFINGGSNTSLKRAGAVSGGATSTYGHVLSFERYSTSSYKEYFPVKIEIGQEADNYPALIRFTSAAGNYSSTDTEYAIGHNNSYSYFKTLRYTGNNANTYSTYQRVFLYQPAQNYIITTERIPTGGGEITLTDGVLEVNGDMTSQESQQVSFYVGINEGYTVESVTVTDAGNNVIPVECTHQTLQGNNYTFTMPGANVHIVVRYTQANYHVIHAECTPTYGGEYTFNSGTFDMSDQVVSFADNTVNFGITASLGYVFTGITATSQDGQSTVLPLTDNGDGTYSFTMPDNDVTLSASFDRVIGDIFDLVTSGSQIVENGTYIIVTQNHDKVMKHWNKTDGTFQGAPIVEWVTQDKTKVRVDDNACFFRLDDLVPDTANNNYKSAYMNTLVGYLGYGEYDGTTGKVISTPDRSGYNRATMYISAASNASNYLCTFDSIKTANRTIRYEEATNSFKIINYGNSTDERVWLYKLAESYHNISTVCTPPEGGRISVNASSAQAGETVTFTVTTNEGYTFDGVTVTYTDGTQGTITVTENNGEYSFTMPDNAVTIAAGFTVIPVGYVIDSERIPEAGGYVNINNNGNNATANAMPGETVNVWVGTNWGYRIASVTAENTTTGETVTLTTGTTSDAGNNYSFTMPVGNVHITAKFYKNLFLLGTAMGRTGWCAAGPEFTFDAVNDQYYLDVYFKGIRGVSGMSDDEYGYFSLATEVDNITWQTADNGAGTWSNVKGRLAAVPGNPYNNEVKDGDTGIELSSQNPDNAFKIKAGIYRIIVNHDLSEMSIVENKASLTFDPESGSTVNPGQIVTISSDLQTMVHGIAQQYGITEDTQAFKNTTDNWASQETDNTALLDQLGSTTVKAEANIGYIIVPGEALYTIVPVSYTIEALWYPQNAGSVTLESSSSIAGQTVTFAVDANTGYQLTSLTVSQNSNAQPVSYTDNGDGTYTFTMPADNVIIMANFSVAAYGITTVCNPTEGGYFNDIMSAATAGTEVTFSVGANEGYVLNNVTLTVGDQVTTLTPDGNGVYSFTMPSGPVTVTANFDERGDLYLLGTDNGKLDWDPMGNKFHYDRATDTYTLTVYYKGIRDEAGMTDDHDGHFNLSTVNHESDWDYINPHRLVCRRSNYTMSDGETEPLYPVDNDHPATNEFRVVAGIYTLTVPGNKSTIHVTKIPVTTTITPAPHDFNQLGYVPYGTVVTGSSDLDALVHDINPNEVMATWSIECGIYNCVDVGGTLHETVPGNQLTFKRNGKYQVHASNNIGWITSFKNDNYAYAPLRYIEGNQSMTAYEYRQIVCDTIVGVWAADRILWAKDLHNRALNLDRNEDELPDYVIDLLHKQDADRGWDQSNWVMLDFTNLLEGLNDDEALAVLNQYVNKELRPMTVSGKYLTDLSHRIELDALPVVLKDTIGYPGYMEDPLELLAHPKDGSAPLAYYYNHYVPCNFMGNTVITHPEIDLDIIKELSEDEFLDGDDWFVFYEWAINTSFFKSFFETYPDISEVPCNWTSEQWEAFEAALNQFDGYFFVKAKVCEVAHVWGVWHDDGENGVFTVYNYGIDKDGNMHNEANLSGAFRVGGWEYNRLTATPANYGRPTGNDALVEDEAYEFHVAIMRPGDGDIIRHKRNAAGLSGKDCEPFDDEDGGYLVYPLDLMSRLSAVTEIQEVVVDSGDCAVDSVRYYNMMGQESRVPFEGINIVVTRYKDGSMTSKKILR